MTMYMPLGWSMSLTLTTILLPIAELCIVARALQNPKWVHAMQEEYDALIRNSTWTLVPSRLEQNVVGKKWVFRIKQHPDGFVARYKARLVARGFHQQLGINFHETFSPVINPITVSIVLSIALNCKWGIRQLDVNNVFLNGHLIEEVYIAQP